jgi:excisionase family DNA binding protein
VHRSRIQTLRWRNTLGRYHSENRALLLSTKEVADALCVSERHVKNLIYPGALPSITLGRLRRIYIGDLHAYIDERREVARPRRPF